MWLFECASIFFFHHVVCCLCVHVNAFCTVGFPLQSPQKALCQCSCRHLNRHETHFQWDTNHLFLSQRRAVLQCQPSAISTQLSFLAEHWQAFRVSWGHSRPWEDQQASNKWSSGQHRLSYCEGLWQLNHKKVTGAKDQLQTVSKAPSVLLYMQPYSLSLYFVVYVYYHLHS